MKRVVAVVLIGAVLVAPTVAGDDSGWTYAPAAVSVATLSEGTTLVQWAPGVELPDFFNVWGVSSGGAVLLGQVDALGGKEPFLLSIEANFPTYAVSGVRGGVESPMTFAVAGDGNIPLCLRIEHTPEPGVAYCLPDGSPIEIGLKIATPSAGAGLLP